MKPRTENRRSSRPEMRRMDVREQALEERFLRCDSLTYDPTGWKRR